MSDEDTKSSNNQMTFKIPVEFMMLVFVALPCGILIDLQISI